MAARNRRIQVSDEWRQKIAAGTTAGMLMKRLRDNSLGTLDPPMTQGQIRSAEIVLAKIVPNLSSVDHSGEINHNHVARVPEPQPDLNTWQLQHDVKPKTVQ
jgi:hypothetical protein